MPERIGQPAGQHTPTPWPDGIHSRYGTLLGATVDIRPHGYNDHAGRPVQSAQAKCTGCGDGHGNDALDRVRDWAQTHAAMCRALPRPAVTT